MIRKTWLSHLEDSSYNEDDDQHNEGEIIYEEGPLVLAASYNR